MKGIIIVSAIIIVVLFLFISSIDGSYAELSYITVKEMDSVTGEKTLIYSSVEVSSSEESREYIFDGRVSSGYIELFRMRRTIYTRDHRCIPDPSNAVTSSGEKLQTGTAAINVVRQGNRWVYNSPLKIGDRIYIPKYGEFIVRDTGTFNPHDRNQSYWTIDLFLDVSRSVALEMGVKMVDVYLLERGLL